jgi:hypothetical protein
MTEYTNISEEINKLKSNLAKLEDIVNKANTAKEIKRNLLKEAKENKLISKDEIKEFSNNIENFDKIAADKNLIKMAKSKLLKLELEMILSEYNSLQTEYAQVHNEIENQVKSEQENKPQI